MPVREWRFPRGQDAGHYVPLGQGIVWMGGALNGLSAAPGMVFMTFHFAESATNLLTSDAVDPTAKIPEYKVCAVRVERLPAPILQGELTPQ